MQEYGYQEFSAQPEHFRFLRWLYTRAWWSEERLTVLFDLALARLIERKILLPGVSVLERLVSSVREHASSRLWQLLAGLPPHRNARSWTPSSHGLRNEINSSKVKRSSLIVMLYNQKAEEIAIDCCEVEIEGRAGQTVPREETTSVTNS
jgi:hypothetical protein